MKEKEIRKWFLQHITDDEKPYFLDKNQAKIIADSHQNTLVTARAGSGKTRTLIAKIVYLTIYEQISPEEIIVFAFNKKARAEVNERLTKIKFDGKKIFSEAPDIATTFHAFAYHLLGGKNNIGEKLISEEQENQFLLDLIRASHPPEKLTEKISEKSLGKLSENPPAESPEEKLQELKQFIVKSEQKFFQDYQMLDDKIDNLTDNQIRRKLSDLNLTFKKYQKLLESHDLINFNQMLKLSAEKLQENYQKNLNSPYKYILIDEYQDFSLLFLTLIKALRKTCPAAKMLCVGDDWQAINRFAGSDVEYFLNFQKYFPDDNAKLFIPTNYRSGKKIVKNANYFMSTALRDYHGCKSGSKIRGKIYLRDIQAYNMIKTRQDLPLLLENYLNTILNIIRENPNKSIKILHRNNNLNFRDWSLEKFVNLIRKTAIQQKILDLDAAKNLISESTIHRSKGLEADIVILLEIDADKFPAKDKTNGIYKIFGEDNKTIFADEARLFYVALTRPKEKLYILSKTTILPKDKNKRKWNFFNYLNDNWLEVF